MKNALVGGLIVAVMFLVFIILLVSDSTPEVEQKPVKNIETPRTESSTRREYMKGCDPENNNQEYCACTYNYLEDKIGELGILEEAVELEETKKIPPVIYDAIQYCIELNSI